MAARVVLLACLAAVGGAALGLRALAPVAGAVPEDERTLRVWLAADYAGHPAVREAVGRFEARHPGVRVSVVGVEWSALITKLKAATPVGLAPDVAHQHPFVFGALGLAEPVDDLWRAAGLKDDDYLPGAVADVTWAGRRYGLPLDTSCLALFYNRELFRRDGVAPPDERWTFDDLARAARRLTHDDDHDGRPERYGFVLSASPWQAAGIVHAAGGALMAELPGRPARLTLDRPEVAYVLELFGALARDGASPVPPSQPRQSDRPVWYFGNRRAAMFLSGPWDLARLAREFPPGLEVATAPLPRGPRGTVGNVAGGGGLFIPRGCQRRALAFELMRALSDDAASLGLARQQGTLPVRRRLQGDPWLRSRPGLGPFLERLAAARPYPLEVVPEAAQAFQGALQGVFAGGEAKALLRRAQREGDRAAVELAGP